MSRMGDWLARDLFDERPEGVPELEPEEDDEDEGEADVARSDDGPAPE